jgi:hypothetical protein
MILKMNKILFSEQQKLLLIMRLDTVVTKEGISVKFFPFHCSFRHYRWERISKAVVLKYSVFESGGWGIKSSRVYNKVYSVWGNKGLKLELTNGHKLLIGTQKANELEAILYKIKRLDKE